MLSDFFSPVDTKGDGEFSSPSDDPKWPRRGRIAVASLIALTSTYLGGCIAALVVYSVMFPPITGVQLQHSVESALSGSDPRRVYVPIPLSEMDDSLPRAAVAGEDSRFFQHHGVDWQAVNAALDEYQEGKRLRGGSSITQQLVKNLFMTTHRTPIRKALEIPLAYAAELLLTKRRILELYVNVIEWGPGIYGAEAASQYYYGVSAADLTYARAAALAACIPNPRERHPNDVSRYQRIIQIRMRQLGPLPLPSDSYEVRPRRATPPRDSSPTAPPAESSSRDTRVDTAVSDRSSRTDSLASIDTLPPADSLPVVDPALSQDRGAKANDTSRTDRPPPPRPDSLQRDTDPTVDSVDTP